MQFISSPEQFKSALSTVERAVASTSTLPILNNVLVSARASAPPSPAQVELSATDLGLSLTTYILAHVMADGAVTVLAHLLLDVVGGLPSERIVAQLHQRTQILNLSCARFSANLKGLAAQAFPALVSVEPTLHVNGRAMRAACEQVAFAAAAKDDTRVLLTGVSPQGGLWFEFGDEGLRLVATDGHRLATTVVRIDASTSVLRSLIVPARACHELARISPAKHARTVGIGLVDANQIVFHVDETQLITNLIEGTYPPVLSLFENATTHVTRVRVRRVDLARALRVAEIMTPRHRSQAAVVKLELAPAQPLVISASASEADHHSELEAQACPEHSRRVEGQPMQISVQPRYLLAALEACDDFEYVTLTMQSATQAMAVRSAEGSPMLHLIMPAREPGQS